MKVQKVPANCLLCGKRLDGAAQTSDEGGGPTPGSLSICAYCAAIAIYDEHLHLRPLTEAEAREVEADPELCTLLRRATGAIRFYQGGKN